jgi:hypothetical protein
VSTDELIVQSFEWLADYSQHYRESWHNGRRGRSNGNPAKSVNDRFCDPDFQQWNSRTLEALQTHHQASTDAEITIETKTADKSRVSR